MARRTSVKSFQQFPVLSRKVELLAQEAVQAAAVEGAKAAEQAAGQRTRTGRMGRMTVVPAHGTPQGYAAGFASGAWYASFQNDGTRSRRTRSVKDATVRRRSSPSGQARQQRAGQHPGISPLRFFEAGQRAGRAALRRELERGV